MTHLEQAIKDAMTGEWKSSYDFDHIHRAFVHMRYRSSTPQPLVAWMIERPLLDPAFWRALGKARGWDESYFHNEARDPYYSLSYNPETDSWKMNWHRLIDHLAEGKDVESFFAGLVSTPN